MSLVHAGAERSTNIVMAESNAPVTKLIIFPAIDLRQGRVVRLRQGDPRAQTTYSEDPAETAASWARQGAQWLHVVNLDGALTVSLAMRNVTAKGETLTGAGCGDKLPVNLRRLADIRAAVNLPIQYGGGLRSLTDIELALETGAARVVLGTVAVQQPALVGQAIERFGADRIVVGLDARDGRVATHGWQETSGLTVLEVARRMADLGARRTVYTDISRDGMLTGVNVPATVALASESGLKVIASGGVGSLDDIRALASGAGAGSDAAIEASVEGVIVGQALYTGAFSLPEALAIAEET
jgi:phosphoribosylformimino-5-aminoimidazole carboxamide ribotide isomerase